MEFITLISRFFANEFLTNQVPKQNQMPPDLFLQTYRDAIGMLTDTFSLQIRGENPTYEKLLDKMFDWARKGGVNITRAHVIPFTQSLAPQSVWQSMKNSDRQALFRRFIVECARKFSIYVISKSTQYCQLLQRGLSLPSVIEQIQLFQKTTIEQFVAFAKREQIKLQNKLLLVSQGSKEQEIENIEAESKLIEDLRAVIGQQEFQIQKLKEELTKLRAERVAVSAVNPVEEEPEAEPEEEPEEQLELSGDG